MKIEEYQRQAEEMYKSIEDKYGLSVYGSRNHANKKFVFLRGRIADIDNLTPKENRFSYPPSKYCADFGRANYPFHPVMYSGSSLKLIAKELSFVKDDWFHLAVFYTPNPVIHFQYLLLLHESISEKNMWHKILFEYKNHITKNLPKNHIESAEKVWERVQMAAVAFQNDDYSETAAIAYHWLYTKNLDALLYSSGKTNEYCNFALHPRFVDNHLSLYKVHLCKWLGTHVSLNKTGQVKGGMLEWHQTTKDDFDEFESGYKDLEQ